MKVAALLTFHAAYFVQQHSVYLYKRKPAQFLVRVYPFTETYEDSLCST